MSSGTVAIEEPYRGALGATRRERVHWSCPCGVLHSVEVVVGIDCAADPELAAALRNGEETFNQAVCPSTGARGRVDVAVVYHDPDEPLFVLVLPAGARARELEERAVLLERLARDVDRDVPPYVAGFAAVHEAAGLRAHLARAVMDTRGVYGVEGAVTLPRMRVIRGEVPEDEAVTSPRMPAVPTELVTIAVAASEADADDDEVEGDTLTLTRRSASDPSDAPDRQASASDESVPDGRSSHRERREGEGGRAAAAATAGGPFAAGSPGAAAGHARSGLEQASADLDDVMGAIDAAIAAIDGPADEPDLDAARAASDPPGGWAAGDDVTAASVAAVREDAGEPEERDPGDGGPAAPHAAAAGERGTGPAGAEVDEVGDAMTVPAPGHRGGVDAVADAMADRGRGQAGIDEVAAHGGVGLARAQETGVDELGAEVAAPPRGEAASAQAGSAPAERTDVARDDSGRAARAATGEAEPRVDADEGEASAGAGERPGEALGAEDARGPAAGVEGPDGKDASGVGALDGRLGERGRQAGAEEAHGAAVDVGAGGTGATAGGAGAPDGRDVSGAGALDGGVGEGGRVAGIDQRGAAGHTPGETRDAGAEIAMSGPVPAGRPGAGESGGPAQVGAPRGDVDPDARDADVAYLGGSDEGPIDVESAERRAPDAAGVAGHQPAGEGLHGGAAGAELGADRAGLDRAAHQAGEVAARTPGHGDAEDSSVSAAWSAAAVEGLLGPTARASEAPHPLDVGEGEAGPDEDLDSIDVPIHVAGEGTRIGFAPLEGAAPPDPTSSRRVGPDGRVTIGLVAEGVELAALVAAELEVRLQLHRMSNFPLLALVFGDAAALDGAEGTAPPRWVLLDIGDEEDRAALHSLGRLFEVHLEIQDGSRDGAVVATSVLSPPLADNVLAALAAAADYLKGVPLDQRSFARARAAFRAPDYDRLGLGTSLAGELDEEVLHGLATPAQVVRAVALVKRFSQPTGEDWLLMTRSYPLESWQASRRAVVKRAFELGIWPGPVAAQIAVGEGLARSRKELVMRLQRHFTALLDQPAETGAVSADAPAESLPAPAHDLDAAAVRENWKSLKAEARALGVPAGEWSQPRSSPIVSESAPIASGTIDLFAGPGEESDGFARPGRRRARTAAYGEPVGGDGFGGRARGLRQGALARLDSAALVEALEDRDRRLAAALELCRRGEESAVGAIFAAVDGLPRGDAGLLLGSVGFLGRAAEPHLLAGLRSRKAHIRQGSALALAVMRSEAGVEAICDLLLDDPTAIWRELARALGETGPIAVMPLAARLGQRSMAARERAAWALAHIGARGHRRPLEALASGRDQVAASVARRAIELIEAAQSDDLAVRGDRAPRDQTMNRSFSRRFFEAVRAERRAAAEAAAAEAAADSETEVEPAAARAVAGRASAMTTGTAVLEDADILDAVDVEGEGEVEVDDRMEVVEGDAGEPDRAPG